MKTSMKTVFASEKIDFVEVSELLVGDYLTMVNDYENVNRFIGGDRNFVSEPYTEEQERVWVRKKLAENAAVFSMIERKSGRFIGNIEFMDLTDTQGELGIAITAQMQDKGFGTEAVAAMTDHGFSRLGLERIFLRTRPFNLRAVHVYTKCGFAEYDRDEDHIYMEILRRT